MVQRRLRLSGKKSGVTIVVGGDAGTAEGDFASCLVWSSRTKYELPVLMIVTNNRFGISTPSESQHGERHIADRAKAFGIKSAVADGNAPEKVWAALETALESVRSTGKPFLLELEISRLYGHSSSSGANRIKEEECPIEAFEKRLIKQGWITQSVIDQIVQHAWEEANVALDTARKESWPDPSTVYDHSFAHNKKAGLPDKDND